MNIKITAKGCRVESEGQVTDLNLNTEQHQYFLAQAVKRKLGLE